MSTAPAPSASEPEVPIGPSVEQWRSMSESERGRFYEQIYKAMVVCASRPGRPCSWRRADQAPLPHVRFDAGDSPAGTPAAGMNVMARSAIAVIDNEGFTPGFADIAEPSHTYNPGYPYTS